MEQKNPQNKYQILLWNYCSTKRWLQLLVYRNHCDCLLVHFQQESNCNKTLTNLIHIVLNVKSVTRFLKNTNCIKIVILFKIMKIKKLKNIYVWVGYTFSSFLYWVHGHATYRNCKSTYIHLSLGATVLQSDFV